MNTIKMVYIFLSVSFKSFLLNNELNHLDALSTRMFFFPDIDTVTTGVAFVILCLKASARNSLPASLNLSHIILLPKKPLVCCH